MFGIRIRGRGPRGEDSYYVVATTPGVMLMRLVVANGRYVPNPYPRHWKREEVEV